MGERRMTQDSFDNDLFESQELLMEAANRDGKRDLFNAKGTSDVDKPTTSKAAAALSDVNASNVTTTPMKTEEASVVKRSLPIYISPTKRPTIKRCGEGDAVKTLVFFDFETTGAINSSFEKNVFYKNPHEFTSELQKRIFRTQKDEFPRITEMSFIAVPRETFEKGAHTMKAKSDATSNTHHLKQRLACNVHTRQVDPRLSVGEWSEYERKQKTVPALVHDRSNLVLKKSFKEEWKGVRDFLDACPKPACLVAHNGMAFDYVVLYGELVRYGLIDADCSIPEGVVFVDSLVAIKDIEADDRSKLAIATEYIDWSIISEQMQMATTSSSRPACETIPENEDKQVDLIETQPLEPTRVFPNRQVTFEQSTPDRPIPPRSTRSEPAKMLGKRRSFSGIVHDDHPLLFLKTSSWTPAKKRRVKAEFFSKSSANHWKFHKEMCAKANRNNLGELYKTVIHGEFDAHYAQDDSEALMQICMAYGQDFLTYVDRFSADFPY